MRTKLEVNPLQGSILKGMLIFALPISLSALLTMLFSCADTVVIGRFGHDGAISAIGASASILNFLVSGLTALSSGITVVFGKYYGERKPEQVTKLLHSLPLTALVLGGGHSIGIPLAVSGQQTFIVPSASMTVHPVRMSGLMIAAPQSYRYFERVQESIVSFVARHSRITQDDFRRLMLADGDMSNDVGTILYGSQAVELGLIDRLGTLSDALEALYGMIGKNG